jgi:hypothetical protein
MKRILNDYLAEMRRIDRQSDTLYLAAIRRWNSRKQENGELKTPCVPPLNA